MMRRAVAVGALLLLAIPCFGGNGREFNALVKTIETQYGVRHVHIPLVGFATFCLRVAGTPGMAGLRLAVFDDIRDSQALSPESFVQSVGAAIGSRWHLFVRVRSHEDGNVTLIYTDAEAKQLEVLLVTLNDNRATIVQTKLKTSEIWKWINNPRDDADSDDPQGPRAHLSVTADDE
jgi:hypothetical protein